MAKPNPKQVLLDIYANANDVSDIQLSESVTRHLQFILDRISQNKEVYTVLITLALYKYLNPNQDIR